MGRLIQGRALTSALTAIGLMLAVGGGFALASGTGGSTIKACVKRGTRALYRAPCRRHDRKLSWSTRGPRGAKGAKGAAGPRGQTGASGLSAAYSDAARTEETATNQPMATVSLPAGKYVINSRAIVEDQNTSTGTIAICGLQQLGASSAMSEAGANLQADKTGNAFSTTVADEATLSLSKPAKVAMECEGGAASVTVLFPTVTAIAVNNLEATASTSVSRAQLRRALAPH